MKITKKTLLSEILETNEKAAEILFEAGLHCIGCPMSMQETLEQGCLAHGIEKKDVDEIVNKINKTK